MASNPYVSKKKVICVVPLQESPAQCVVLEVICMGCGCSEVFATGVARHGAEALKWEDGATQKKNVLGDDLQGVFI